MELIFITNELIFREKLIELKQYFNKSMLEGLLTPLQEDAYKPLKNTYDIVFNNEILYGAQKKMATFWPLKDCFEDGETFLNSDLGKLYQEVIYYFSYYYQVPDSQKGGYNISCDEEY